MARKRWILWLIALAVSSPVSSSIFRALAFCSSSPAADSGWARLLCAKARPPALRSALPALLVLLTVLLLFGGQTFERFNLRAGDPGRRDRSSLGDFPGRTSSHQGLALVRHWVSEISMKCSRSFATFR